ncbi:MAG: NTP transferase domain-containing protein [Candidatus Gracilibacteria bacterium]|nr:NTP transferase domain-containing protein [Candidatus Gracilibacteria bacterium]
MKAIILAAGRGTRLQPLTNTTPKPMIQICGKPILEYLIENIYSDVSEIILVVKYKEEIIKTYFGKSYQGTKITYITQGEEKGTGAALRGYDTDEDVFILYGDSIIDKPDIKKILESEKYGVFAQKVDQPEKYGIFKITENKKIESVIEKPKNNIGNLANLGGFKMKSSILDIVKNISLSERGEYELTDALNIYLETNDFYAFEIEGKFIDIGYPWDILTANSYFLKKLEKSEIKGTIEENVIIKGNVILEEGAILKSGTYIEGNCYIGKNSSIGPHSYIRGETVIGQACKIGNAVEVKNSCFGNNTSAAHLSYIGDSILGNNINIGGGFSSANLRHDNKNIRVMVQNILIDSGKRKLGVIIGDNVKTGINTSTMPGRIIDTGSMTMPGEIVQ